MKTFRIVSIFLLLIICAICEENIFVSQNGNDTEGCGSIQSPCATLQYSIDLYDESNIIIQSNLTLIQPLQVNNKIININSSIGNSTILTAENGFVISSNSTLNFKDFSLKANSFLISSNGSNIQFLNQDLGGGEFNQSIFSFNTIGNSLNLNNVIFSQDLQVQGSFIDAYNLRVSIVGLTTKNIIITEESPFINIEEQGHLEIENFNFQTISLSQSPYIKINGTINSTNDNIVSLISSDLKNILNATYLIETLNTNIHVERLDVKGIQVSKPSLFSFKSTYMSTYTTQLSFLYMTFESISTVPFDPALFAKSQSFLNLTSICFWNLDYPNDAPLLGFAYYCPLRIFIDYCDFSGLKGPAISMFPSENIICEFQGVNQINISNSRFCHTTTTKGSALMLDLPPDIVIPIISTQNVFLNNTASSDGGVVYIRSPSSSVTFTSVSDSFSNNCAGGSGGVFYLNGITHLLSSQSTFQNNSAQQNGGAIYSSNTVQLGKMINVTFFNNYASLNGGAIFANASTYSIENSLSNSNRAASLGGHFYSGFSCLFIKNSKTTKGSAMLGGQIYVKYSYLDISYSDFSDSSALAGGIAFIESGSDIIYFTYSSATNSYAYSYGGAFYIKYVYYTQFSVVSSNFVNTSSHLDGGAIWSEIPINSGFSNYTENNAKNMGGAVYVQNSKGHTFYSDYFDKNSAKQGGAFYFNNVTAKLNLENLSNTTRQSIYCNYSTIDVTSSIVPSFDCQNCSFSTGAQNVGCAVEKNPLPYWVWILVGVGGGVLFVILLSITICVCRRKNQGYQTIQTN